MQTVHGVGIADQDMSENKSSGMNMNMNMNAIQGSTHASMLGRGCINNSHEPELRRKNEKERNYFTGSTTDDLVLPRSDQFGFERGRRISRGGNGPIVVEGGGSRGGTGAARLGGRGRFAMEKSASDRSVGSGSALGSGSSTRMMTSSGTLTSTNTSTSIMSTGSTHTTRSNSIPRGMKYCESLSMDVDL